MTADQRYSNESLEFWANVKLISQRVGYTEKGTSRIKVPSLAEIEVAFYGLGLDTSRLKSETNTKIFGEKLLGYFQYRANVLNGLVEPNLLNKDKAEALFIHLKNTYNPKCPFQ